MSVYVQRGPSNYNLIIVAIKMGVTKYERVSRRDDDYNSDEEQEVELGNRTAVEYGEGGSNLTPPSSSPVDTHQKHTSGSDYRIRGHGMSKTAISTIISTALIILLYFTLSIGLTFYQSSLLEVSVPLFKFYNPPASIKFISNPSPT